MVDIFLLETLKGCPKLLHFRLLISETSRSISLWINNKANPFNLAFVIVLRSQVLTIRRDENDCSHSQVVIGKVPNSFKVKFIFGKASESTLFSVTETESGKFF